MRHDILLVSLLLVLLLPLPQLRADLIRLEEVDPSFENIQTLALTLKVDGKPFIGPTSEGQSLSFTYRIAHTERLFAGMQEGLSQETKDRIFRTQLEDYRFFVEIWRGEPFTPAAAVEVSVEIGPVEEGNITFLPQTPGPYFIVVYMTSEVRDMGVFCARHNIASELCYEEGYLPAYEAVARQAYFSRPILSEEAWSDAFPVAFGGQRFSVTGELTSNVLFLPGIKGSRLYLDDDKLWEPSGDGDIESLFLDDTGRGTKTIYAKAGDVLSETFSRKFYASFFQDLNAAGLSWDPAAYDWRLSLDDLVRRGARYGEHIFYSEANGLPYLEQLLRDLASSSPTGKVSIVAHSNGGLVAKSLLRQMGDAETARLIDTIIFVGVPQSGAPQALAAALFGYGEALPFDACADWAVIGNTCEFLVSRKTARIFAEHSPMTYHLLPSEPYFVDMRDKGSPLVAFRGTSSFGAEQLYYENLIDSASELYDFVLARDGGRQKPEPENLRAANVLSELLVEYARDTHAVLDGWMPPEGVSLYQIAGWGKDTLSGVEFYDKPRILELFGKNEPLHRPSFTEDGDGVVPVESALMTATDNTYWVNLQDTPYTHADLLEVPDVRIFVNAILARSTSTLPALLSMTKPETERRRRIMFFLHSPLTLGAVDKDGRYTGSHEDGSIEYATPEVSYGQLGETQYLLMPAGTPYEIVMYGLGQGTFTLEILERYGNDISTTTSIVDVPTTENTVARISVPEEIGGMSDLTVDIDGNSTQDIVIAPKPGEPVIYGFTEELLPEEESSSEPTQSESGHRSSREGGPSSDTSFQSVSVHAQEPSGPLSFRADTAKRPRAESVPVAEKSEPPIQRQELTAPTYDAPNDLRRFKFLWPMLGLLFMTLLYTLGRFRKTRG